MSPLMGFLNAFVMADYVEDGMDFSDVSTACSLLFFFQFTARHTDIGRKDWGWKQPVCMYARLQVKQ